MSDCILCGAQAQQGSDVKSGVDVIELTQWPIATGVVNCSRICRLRSHQVHFIFLRVRRARKNHIFENVLCRFETHRVH